ncbi:hypothetical protein OSJ57_11170 [Sphingomonas sp. HH69]
MNEFAPGPVNPTPNGENAIVNQNDTVREKEQSQNLDELVCRHDAKDHEHYQYDHP